MTRFLRQFCLLAALALSAAGSARAQVEVVVGASPGVLSRALSRAAADGIISEANRKRAPEPVAGGRLGAYVVALPDSAALRALLAQWASDPDFGFAQPNVSYTLDAAPSFAERRRAEPDPLRDSLYHLDLIRAPEAWALSRGAGVVIGFIDSGADLDHPDLAGQFAINPGEDLDGDGRVTAADFNGLDDDGNGYIDDIRGYDFVDRPDSYEPGDYRERDPDPSDDNQLLIGRGHGTAVAGVLAAAEGNGEGVAGVAPDARLMPLRAFAADGRGDDDDIAAALVYAADAGARVVNMSFGTAYESALLRQAIEYAHQRGVVLVASAGNDGKEDAHYPSDFDAVISVVRLGQNGEARSSLSSHGQQVTLGAPGTGIYTTALPATGLGLGPAGDALYRPVSGSSFSAPMVAGVAALALGLDPSLSASAVRSALVAGARDVGEAGWDDDTGAGLLDASATLLRALPARTEILAPRGDAAIAAGSIPVRITTLDPAFERYDLSYAVGTQDVPESAFEPLSESSVAALGAVVHTWDVAALPDTSYTLRLRVALRSGGTVERRRRVTLDRTAPVLRLRGGGAALVGSAPGLAFDVETDDRARVCLDLDPAPSGFEPVCSDQIAGRHGLVWRDLAGSATPRRVLITATNEAGMSASVTRGSAPPARTPGPVFTDARLAVPSGHLLPRVTDFDEDGLPELVLNEYDAATLGDTLGVWEWTGSDFARQTALEANLLPRDVGDTNGDGLQELLLQVKGATFLLEAQTRGNFPLSVLYADTTVATQDTTFLRGALLTDLDSDGRGEVLGHDGSAWVLVESDGGTYRRAATLANPTSVRKSLVASNEYGVPEALVRDLDGDGQMDLLVGDNDGDLIRYEARGNDRYEVVWTHETERYNAGALFAAADLDGDGLDEVLTLTQNWPNPVDGDLAPAFGFYTLWRVEGDALVAVDSLVVASEPSRYTSAERLAQHNGEDALLLHQAPHVYTLHLGSGGRLALGAYAGPETGGPVYRGSDLVVHDFAGDGASDVVLSATDGALHMLRRDGFDARPAPPRWLASYALERDAATPAFTLVFTAPEADSIEVLEAPIGGAFDRIAWITEPGAQADTLRFERSEARAFALRTWLGGVASALSPSRAVRPAPLPRYVSAEHDASGITLTFTAPVDPPRATFVVAGRARPAISVLGGRGVFLAIPPTGEPTSLAWSGLVAQSGAPIPARTLTLAPPEDAAPLFVESWSIDAPGQVRLRFSAPVTAASAEPSHYALAPAGRIVAVDWEAAAPREVLVSYAGIAAGASGQNVRLTLGDGIESQSGQRLDADSRSILLTQSALDLSGVFVYPNPGRFSGGLASVTVGGLPSGAHVHILQVDGTLVRTLQELDRDGGVRWDLRDTRGQTVAPGVYLVMVEGEGGERILRKAAILP